MYKENKIKVEKWKHSMIKIKRNKKMEIIKQMINQKMKKAKKMSNHKLMTNNGIDFHQSKDF
jgi:hypothetical protein